MAKKSFDELTITDDFMFCKVMQEPELCKDLLRLVLEDKIGEITNLTYQKTIDEGNSSKSVRLDVWVGDSNQKLYDIEMQVTNNRNLARRLRYYHSIIDLTNLNEGQDYETLPDSYVIFFCPFDYPGNGLPVYTFKNVCIENKEILLGDGATKVLVNSKAADKAQTPELRAFLAYMNGEASEDAFVQRLEEQIQKIKASAERRQEYMLMTAYEADMKREGRAEGRAEGIVEGREKGEEMILALISRLMAERKFDEISKIQNDKVYRQELMKKYQLK